LVAGIVSAATACLAPLYNIATEATSEEKTGKKAIALGLSFVGLATGLFSACIPFCGVISKGIKVAVSVLGSAFVGLGHAVRTALYKPTNADDPNVKDKKLAMKGQIAGSFMGAICAGIGTGLKEALKNLPLCSTFLALGKLLGAGLSLIGSATEVHRDGRLAAQAQAAKPQNGTDSETGANTLSEIGSATEVHRDSELAARTQAATPQNGTDLETGASALSGSETSETSVSDGSQSTSGSETSGTSVSDESQSTSEYETSGTSASDESQSTSDRGNITLELSGERETPEGDGHQTDIAVGVPAQSYA
jgi:hypothetical protein